MSSDPHLDAGRIRLLLTELGERLSARGIEGRLYLVGGAAMAIAYLRDRVTRDVDAVFEPKSEIYEEAARMAADHELASDWLNDAVKGLLPDRHPPIEGIGTFSAPGIHVGVASAEYLFAMKAQAARIETDGEDLRTLADVLGLESSAEATDLVERFYAPHHLRPVTRLLLEEILDGPTR
ncbi:MAG: hypothetical protein IT195_07430 [Microthrixaceae bacterium]|nr:hypothetical protein [Microthrixaceae bacterium]